MNKTTLSFFMTLAFPITLSAQSVDDFRVLHKYSADQTRAILIVHEGGHRLGQPYQVELRVQCNSDSKIEILDLPVQDSLSVCDLDPDSVKVNSAQTALAFKAKMANVEKYNRQVASGAISPETSCQDKTFVKKFSLKNLCP